MKIGLTGWQIVALVALLCGTIVGLVAMGQTLGAITGVGIMILAALGFTGAQQFVNAEKVSQVKDLANGNNKELREQIEKILANHAEERRQAEARAALERQQFQQQLTAVQQQTVAYAAAAPPDAKPELPS